MPKKSSSVDRANDEVMEFLRKAPKVPNDKLVEIASREEVLFTSLILKDLDLMTDAVESGMSPVCFQNETPRKIFKLAAEHFDRHQALLTRQSMESILASTTTAEDAAYLQSQYDAIYAEFIKPKTGEYRMLKNNVESRFVQRQAYHAVQTYAERLLTSTTDQKALVAELQNVIGEITTFGDASSFIQSTVLSEELKRLKQEYYDRRDHPENYHGIRCGYPAIDNDFNGFVKRRYMVLTATEGGGKTTMMLNFARNFAVNGSNVVYVTIESTNRDIARRLLTIHSSVSYNRITRGGTDMATGLPPFVIGELDAATEDLCSGAGNRFHLIQVLEHTPLDAIFRRINRRRAYAPVDVVFIDYLQVIGREKSFGERVDQEIAYVSSKLRAWGRANNVLTVTANQIKSAKGGKLQEAKVDDEDLIITKADTSGTKEIAGAADYMFGVFVPRSKDRLVLYSTKTRMGRDTQKYVFTYDAESGRVETSAELGDADLLVDKLRDKDNRRAVKEGKPLVPEAEPTVPRKTAVDVETLQNGPVESLPIAPLGDSGGGFGGDGFADNDEGVI
jgi:replicative DNA helicase